jgi:hypothetical protein
MADIKLNIGMLAATCALCAVEVGVESPAYENAMAATVCTVCGGAGIYLGYENAKAFFAKTKGPLKGRIRKVRETLQNN